jgi:hypothetical protein
MNQNKHMDIEVYFSLCETNKHNAIAMLEI